MKLPMEIINYNLLYIYMCVCVCVGDYIGKGNNIDELIEGLTFIGKF